MALIKPAKWKCDYCGKPFTGHEHKVCYLDWCGKCEIEFVDRFAIGEIAIAADTDPRIP